jgi:hypothetical protein
LLPQSPSSLPWLGHNSSKHLLHHNKDNPQLEEVVHQADLLAPQEEAEEEDHLKEEAAPLQALLQLKELLQQLLSYKPPKMVLSKECLLQPPKENEAN